MVDITFDWVRNAWIHQRFIYTPPNGSKCQIEKSAKPQAAANSRVGLSQIVSAGMPKVVCVLWFSFIPQSQKRGFPSNEKLASSVAGDPPGRALPAEGLRAGGPEKLKKLHLSLWFFNGRKVDGTGARIYFPKDTSARNWAPPKVRIPKKSRGGSFGRRDVRSRFPSARCSKRSPRRRQAVRDFPQLGPAAERGPVSRLRVGLAEIRGHRCAF